MDAFAKSMDNYFIPTKKSHNEHLHKKGGNSITPANMIIGCYCVILADTAFSNLGTSGFHNKNHTFASNMGVWCYILNAIEIIFLIGAFIMLFEFSRFGLSGFKIKIQPTDPKNRMLSIFVLLSWVVAINLLINTTMYYYKYNIPDSAIGGAGFLNVIRFLLIIYVFFPFVWNLGAKEETGIPEFHGGRVVFMIYLLLTIILSGFGHGKSNLRISGIVIACIMFISMFAIKSQLGNSNSLSSTINKKMNNNFIRTTFKTKKKSTEDLIHMNPNEEDYRKLKQKLVKEQQYVGREGEDNPIAQNKIEEEEKKKTYRVSRKTTECFLSR